MLKRIFHIGKWSGNGPNKEREQKHKESVNNIVVSTAEIKQEEKTKKFPGVEMQEGHLDAVKK